MRLLAVFAVILVFVCSCASAGPTDVLVVMNGNSTDSVAVAKYYAARRGIASKYICKIYCPTTEIVQDADFQKTIREPIKAYMKGKGLVDTTDYIVLTRGIPIKTLRANVYFGVDSVLTVLFSSYSEQLNNPYYGANKRFRHRDYNMYLVTRLDGLTLADAKALVDRSLAAKPNKGLFLLDFDPGYDSNPGYKTVNDKMRGAAKTLRAKALQVELEQTKDFVSRGELMGYFSWGSNDGKYSQETFNKLRFLPGSIAELGQSTSAFTLTSNRALKGKRSYITDLVAQGVTGVKGYVYEPYVTAIADAQSLFDHYTGGYNLAESFYAASRYIHWRDIVLGDPLCCPYRYTGKD